MNFFVFLFWIFSFDIYVTNGERNGIAVFNNTESGLQGIFTLHRNAGIGTYLVGQLHNISCLNTSSATRNPKDVSQLNSCLLGMTINNIKNGTNSIPPTPTSETPPILEPRFMQTVFNLSRIKFPPIKGIFNGSYKPFPNLGQTSTQTPLNISITNRLKTSCGNIGDVYNPSRKFIAGPLGILSPPGVIGNLMVNNGTGSLMMGPLELRTVGPTSVIGMALVIWMDSIKPEINGTTIRLKTGPNDRILDCSTILPLI